VDTKQRIVAWLNAYDTIFDQLQDAVTATAQAAGQVGDEVSQNGAQSMGAEQALADAQQAAQHLNDTVLQARQMPRIPDESTQTSFDAGLGRWLDAAQTLQEAAARRDVPELQRAARALDAGTDGFLRAAAALRRATGQPPDPNNPRN
jgi:acyl transferase domain-containing protein